MFIRSLSSLNRDETFSINTKWKEISSLRFSNETISENNETSLTYILGGTTLLAISSIIALIVIKRKEREKVLEEDYVCQPVVMQSNYETEACYLQPQSINNSYYSGLENDDVPRMSYNNTYNMASNNTHLYDIATTHEEYVDDTLYDMATQNE